MTTMTMASQEQRIERAENPYMNNAYEINLGRLRTLAREQGLMLNPDAARVEKVVRLMTENFLAVGEYVCPCKQEHRPTQKGLDKACPCPEWQTEIVRDGHCFCRLFFTPQRAREAGA